ncbi:MAG: carbamoyltransferase HypF [Flavobacteriaceae bacterium]|nr:carbamoyltransferase HypF [Flavobacteriaceae bacterium]
MSKTFKIQINGRVQGVGFRPFVFNLAQKLGLKGSVSNNQNGVLIFINSERHNAENFLDEIKNNHPKVAVITQTSIEEVTSKTFESFNIILNETKAEINIPLTPDFAICNNCKTEVLDTKNRRYNYAFTTCTQCGPRYSITKKYPFERHNTTISKFEMCPNCLEEYNNPIDNRFHSQTNSCATCGIQLEFLDNKNNIIETNQSKIIETVVSKLEQGNIIAVKNTNGYLLCCDATNTETINQLRERKQRPNKPFAILYSSIEDISNEFVCSAQELETLQSNIAPIVILKNSKNTTIATNAIAPNLNQTGVMLPSSALLNLFSKTFNKPLVATSGNIHKSPIISENDEAISKLNQVYDFILNHNLDIEFPQDDSVVRFANDEQLIVRRSRGMAPSFLDINTSFEKPILAMGAHLKSTFTLLPNQNCYTSQYFGNLDSFDVFGRYQNTINQYLGVFNIIPKVILVDAHSQYQSSVLGNDLAEKINAEVYKIQHHKAHFASVLGEHQLFNTEEKILGVVWDGTGLGDDNQIWGGEFFTYQNNTINRLTHFEYFDWIANDKMAKEPRLSLFSLIEDKTSIKDKFTETEFKIYSKTLENNTLKTSSVGRLFDAVSSILNLCDNNTFEAEASMLLEHSASTYPNKNCIDFLEGETSLSSKKIIENIHFHLKNGEKTNKLAASFIYTLALSIIKISEKENIKTIACSGGVFQNAVLIKMLSEMTEKSNIILKINCKLSTNDENISFGQLMYYQHCKN